MRRHMNGLATALMLGFMALGLAACSGQQQDEEDLEISQDEQGNENTGQDDAAEGNGQENFVENDEEGSLNNNNQGAAVNADTEGDTETVNATLDNTGGGNAPPPINNTAAAPGPAPAPVATAPAPPPAEGSAPVPGGRVRYARQGGVQVVNAPGGAPVTQLSQGDHPVTWEENGWLRIANGMYVSIDSMSDKGVPRTSGPRAWNQ